MTRILGAASRSANRGGRRRMDYLSEPFLIDGRWQAASGTRFGAVTNPANGMQIGKLAFAETGELDAALSAAQRGFAAWKRVPAVERRSEARRVGKEGVRTGRSRGARIYSKNK